MLNTKIAKKNLLRTISKDDNNIAVDAKLLHKFLRIKTRFRDWIRRTIKNYGFVENVDYAVSLKNERNSSALLGGRPSKNYVLTLECAKEIAVVQKNELGRYARRYYIQCSKELHQQQKKINQLSRGDWAIKFGKEYNHRLKLQQKMNDFFSIKGMTCMTDVADKFVGLSAVRANRVLHLDGIQYKRGGNWHLYQAFSEKHPDLASQSTSVIRKRNGQQFTTHWLKWTNRGICWLINYFMDKGYHLITRLPQPKVKNLLDGKINERPLVAQNNIKAL